MSPEELAEFKPNTVAQEIALKRLQEARKEKGLLDAKEVTDRTEGKAPQFIGFGTTEEVKQTLVEFIDATSQNTDSD
jgi:hypothetical protein